jgi:hypothetical protein
MNLTARAGKGGLGISYTWRSLRSSRYLSLLSVSRHKSLSPFVYREIIGGNASPDVIRKLVEQVIDDDVCWLHSTT